MKLTDIISKQIINIYDGKICGTIYDILYKSGKICYLKAFDKSDDEYLIDTSKIYSNGKDAITIKNNSAIYVGLPINESLFSSPIGKNVYSLGGDLIGKIEDIQVDDSYNIKNYIIQEKEIPYQNVQVGQELAFYDNSKQKIKRCNFAIKVPNAKPNNNQKVITFTSIDANEKEQGNNLTLISDEPSSLQIEGNKMDNQVVISPTLSPQKIIGIGSGKFLIKRKVDKTIYGINNEILIKKGGIITQNILDNCTKHGRLFELALHSIDVSISTKNTPR